MDEQIAAYARLLLQVGVNLQPGQPLRIDAELGHREFVRVAVAEAYRAGALYVEVNWSDPLCQRARFIHSQEAGLDFAPDFIAARAREYLDRKFATLSLTGDEFPDAFVGVDPGRMLRARMASHAKLAFFMDALMADAVQWCVAGVPTAAWASKVFPGATPAEAVALLWAEIFRLVRLDQPDPAAAWRAHDARLTGIAHTLMIEQVRAVHFLDAATDEHGQARTDLMVGLTDTPAWVGASSTTPEGFRFMPNMPTEEIFSTPHLGRTRGWVRTSKPVYMIEQEVRDAYFRFEDGFVTEFRATKGGDALAKFFEIDGTRRLGEVALVDIRSPISVSGLVYGDTLFDENAVCHIAFGKAYPAGVVGGRAMGAESLAAMGANEARAHSDVMIGTDTMDVTGLRLDGSGLPIMRAGKFVIG